MIQTIMQTVDYHGYKCSPLTNGVVRLLVTQDLGPRILSFGFEGRGNLFAVLPDFVTSCPGVGLFYFHGGHRLWCAPEEPIHTYLPDNMPVEIISVDDGFLITQPTEPRTGLQKSIEIRLQDDCALVTMSHRITNQGTERVAFAPWAITMFRTGGVAVLPQSKQATGLLPNRSLALWPYSNLTDPNVQWGDDLVLVRAGMESAFKVGFPNPRGWLAYWLDDTLFVKRADFDPRAQYLDLGSSSECYCNGQFLELETLAPILTVAPGDSATHIETWELYEGVKRPDNEKDAQVLANNLGLP